VRTAWVTGMEITTNTGRPVPTDEQSLVAGARLRRDDPSGERALGSLIDRYKRTLWALAWGYAGRGASREDLYQEAVIGFIRAVDTYDPAKGPFGPWAWMWARTYCAKAAKALRAAAQSVSREETDLERASDDEPLADAVAELIDRRRMTSVLTEVMSLLPQKLQIAAMSPNPSQRPARRRAEAMLRHPCLRSVVVGGRQGGGSSRTTRESGGHPEHLGTFAELLAVTSVPDPRGDWLRRAACRGMKPEVFFLSGPDRSSAASACQNCPVKGECLRDALALPDWGGVRAGTSERTRRALKSEVAASEERLSRLAGAGAESASGARSENERRRQAMTTTLSTNGAAKFAVVAPAQLAALTRQTAAFLRSADESRRTSVAESALRFVAATIGISEPIGERPAAHPGGTGASTVVVPRDLDELLSYAAQLYEDACSSRDVEQADDAVVLAAGLILLAGRGSHVEGASRAQSRADVGPVGLDGERRDAA
jgi:RNA polymerase sigma factor (sigma-70 family)